MRPVAASLLLLAGCSSIFGLDSPVLLETTVDGAAPQDMAPADVPLDMLADVPSGACPTSYNLSYQTSRYRIISPQALWLDAAQDCADDLLNGSKHTHLVVVGSDAERTQLASMGLVGGWIGLSDIRTEGTYRWVTAEPTTYPPASGTPWSQGEPDNALGQDCVVASVSALWLDANCGATSAALCECDDFPDDPSRY